jgi:threonine dehydratase
MALPTPLEPAEASLADGRRLFLKREDVHELGAFKWRAALPVLEGYRSRGAPAVVTASTGNHGAATAWAADRLGLRAVVYAPEAVSETKLAFLGRLGADVRLVGTDVDEAKAAARSWAATSGLPFFEDGAEPMKLDAYAAIGREILEQLEGPPAAVVVPVGNGALLAGTAVGLAASPETIRVGVVAAGAPVMALSWEARRPVECGQCATLADGLAVRVAVPLAVQWLNEAADRMLRVSERAIARAVATFDAAGIRAEGAAAAGLAALAQLEDVDGPIVLIVTGRNIDEALLERCCTDAESFPG